MSTTARYLAGTTEASASSAMLRVGRSGDRGSPAPESRHGWRSNSSSSTQLDPAREPY